MDNFTNSSVTSNGNYLNRAEVQGDKKADIARISQGEAKPHNFFVGSLRRAFRSLKSTIDKMRPNKKNQKAKNNKDENYADSEEISYTI